MRNLNLSGARQVRRGDSPSSSEKGCREKAAIESGAKGLLLEVWISLGDVRNHFDGIREPIVSPLGIWLSKRQVIQVPSSYGAHKKKGPEGRGSAY
nr:hypothetical protein CFP56_79425 [Quercus suber]